MKFVSDSDRSKVVSFARHSQRARTMSQDRIVAERLVLAIRTDRFSEYRSQDGALLVFEIASRCTSFGRLCTKLAQMPGVSFVGPARFQYKGNEYEVSIPHIDYRVGPVDLTSAPLHTDELLNYTKEHIVRRPASVTREVL